VNGLFTPYRLAGPGEMINEISVMAGEINRLTLKTLENSIIWIIEREIILGLMAKHPELLI
jgi:CRP-like cAMP-binding protein